MIMLNHIRLNVRHAYLYAFMCPGEQGSEQAVPPAAGRGKKAVSK